MTCSVCGASGSPGRSHCLICGHATKPGTEPTWDRAPEAYAYEGLRRALEPDETLLGATRGRITGNWRERLTLTPMSLATQYANLGLSGARVLLQPIGPARGEAVGKALASFPIDEIARMAVQDADPLEPQRAVRLIVTLCSGGTLRLKAAGRLAECARDLAAVFDALTAGRTPPEAAPMTACRNCGRRVDGPYSFCPFCGAAADNEPE
jgi:hypothetical protein